MYKEPYFTTETIQSKSRDLLSSVDEFRLRHKGIVLKPLKAALLVLDLQEYFLNEGSHAYIPSALAILPGIARLVTAFTEFGLPVFATQHLNTPEDAGMMSIWWRDLINSQTAYSHNIKLLERQDIPIIQKTQYDAFFHTSLEGRLRESGVEQLIICGVMTHLCCETTARSAFMRGFEVFFTVDGTATYNEELHRATLLTLSHGFAIPILVDEVISQMESNEA